MSRTGASTPDATKAAAAASSNVFSLRRASARFRGAGACDPSSRAATAPLPLDKRNVVPYVGLSERRSASFSMMPEGITMHYRTLGRTGVQVSTLALGAMNFGQIGHTTQDEATAIVDAALEAGINLIDTADRYSGGESEEMVGKAIAGRRDDIVLATKATNPMGDERNHRGSSRRWLVTELDNSLRRLGVDHVDLYQMHRWDPSTSDEET